MDDAIAATALLRFAKTMSDEGLAAAARRHRDELVAADTCLTDEERTAASRRPEGAYSHPARPGRYVHDLTKLLRPAQQITAKIETHVKERVGMARNYGVVIFDAVAQLTRDLDERPLRNCWDTCKPWNVAHLRPWRAAARFSRAPGAQEQPPLADAHPDGPAQTLAQRLAADPAADPACVEAPHDLLWFADLADALAPFHGNESAMVQHAQPTPDLDYRTPPSPEPGRPFTGSVPQAAAEVAQLVAFGATPPPRCGSWPALSDGVCADAVIAAAGADAFPIPFEVSTVDKKVIPGTGLTVELGREPRQLADWSGYMGNCIGQPWYAEEARRGHCVLMALRDKDDGRIVANLDVRRRVGGWQIHELRARFNDAVPAPLEKTVKGWVAELPVPAPPTPKPLLPVPSPRSRRGSARRPAAARLHPGLTAALTAAVERELTAARAAGARRVYAELARGLGQPGQPADFESDAAVIALKRVGPARHVELVRAALETGPSASALWRATRVRPLATAVSRLDPALRDYDGSAH